MIDDSEEPWGVHQGVPKVVPEVKKKKTDPWGFSSEAILGPLGPPGGAPRGPHPCLSFSTSRIRSV